jgi:hypothetical protein
MKILTQLNYECRIVQRGWFIKTIHLERLQFNRLDGTSKWITTESILKTNEVFYNTMDYVRFLLYKESLKMKQA